LRPENEGSALGLNAIVIDARSTIAAALQTDLVKLQASSELTQDALTYAVTLAIARLEACIFGELDDPTVSA
jgi:hypothetical protein